MVSNVVLTAAPADVGLWPVLASALMATLRAARALADVAAVALDVAADPLLPDAEEIVEAAEVALAAE
jgi:TPP-dependent indolepyruvate ferredoxin oxidoreductase alpha subunit